MPLRLCWLPPSGQRIRRGRSPRIARLYSQAESRRKSPDRERDYAESEARCAQARAAGRACRPDLLSAWASRAMSSRLMRASATPNCVLGTGHGRQHDLVQEVGTGVRSIGFIDRSGGAQNIVGGHAPAVAREFVAAARAADAAKNAAADQRLQNRFKMPRRQAMARGKSFCGDRLPMLLHRDIDDRGNSENSFAGKQRHRKLETSRQAIDSPAVVIYYELHRGLVELRIKSRLVCNVRLRFRWSQNRLPARSVMSRLVGFNKFCMLYWRDY